MFITYRRLPQYKHTVHSVKRTMPQDSQILVKIGDEVRPEKIVGIGRKSVGFRRINAAEQLGVKPEELKEHVTKMPGSYVNKDDVIAENKKMFGLRASQVVSPIKGVIYSVDEATGVITMNYEPEEIRIVSGVHGTVSDIDPDEYTVTMKTNVLELTGRVGLGNRREGSIHLVGQPDLPISEKQIEASWENKIIVGGSLITRKVLYHCIALKVQGIVTGGMHWEDYASLVGSRGKFEDVGISIILMEGYGNMPLSKELFDYLHQYQGKFSFIEGATNKLVVPDSGDIPRAKGTSERVYGTLEEGTPVKLLTLQGRGESGTIKELHENVKLENGITTDTATVVSYNGTEVEVPVSSLEIVKD